MIGSKGPRMLRVDDGARRRVERLVRRHRQQPRRAWLRCATLVDEACREVGRDPGDVERTVAVLVRTARRGGPAPGRSGPGADCRRSAASPSRMAEALRAYAREGIGHVQLVLDPDHRWSRSAPSRRCWRASTGHEPHMASPPSERVGRSFPDPVLACRPRCEPPIVERRGRASRTLAAAVASAGRRRLRRFAAVGRAAGDARPPPPRRPRRRSPSQRAGHGGQRLTAPCGGRTAHRRRTTRAPADPVTSRSSGSTRPTRAGRSRSASSPVRDACARPTDWKAGDRPGQGEPPVAFMGLNILVEWGPDDRRRTARRPTTDSWRPPRRSIDGARSARARRLERADDRRRSRASRRRHGRRRPPSPAPPAQAAPRRRPRNRDRADGRSARPRAASGRAERRRVRPRQADHRAPAGRRPSAVHPDRGRSRRVRGGGPGADEPPDRARHPPGRRRHRPAQARLPPDGHDRHPLRERPSSSRSPSGSPRCPRWTTWSSPPARTTSSSRPCARTTTRCSRFLAERLRAIDGVRETETFVYLRLVKQTYQYGTR